MSADNWTTCPRCKDPKESFREDYEIYGADEGTVTVSYSGSCTKCRLSLSFEDDHPIEGVNS